MIELPFVYNVGPGYGASTVPFGALAGHRVRLRGAYVTVAANGSDMFTGPGTISINGFADSEGNESGPVVSVRPVAGDAVNPPPLNFGERGVVSAIAGAGLSVSYASFGSDPAPSWNVTLWGELISG